MKNLLIAVIFLIAVINICSGCITTRKLERAIIDYDNPSKEMPKPLPSPILLSAVYGGIVEKENKSYHLVQIHGALKGKDRYINVYMPLSDKGSEKYKAFMKESDTPVMKKRDIYCIYITFIYGNYQEFSGHLTKKGKPGPGLIPFIIKNYRKGLVPDPLKQKSLMVFNLQRGVDDVNFIILNKKNENEWTVDKDLYFSDLDIDLCFEERSRALSIIMRGGYLGTAIIDTVLFPVYVILYLVSGPVK